MEDKKLTLGQKKHLKVIQNLANNKDYLKSLNKVRGKYDIPKDGYNFTGTRVEIENQQRLKKAEMDHTEGFNEDLDIIIDKFTDKGLKPSYSTYLENIIIFGIGHLQTFNFGIHPNWIEIPPNIGRGLIQEEKNKRLKIEIYGNTSKKDITDGWDIIEEYRKQLPGYDPSPFRANKKPGRDRHIIEIYKSGTTRPDQIVDEYNEKFADDSDMESFIGEDTVRSVISNYLSKS